MRDKLYYHLEEVAEMWGCNIRDLFYSARHEGLKLSFLIRNSYVTLHKPTKYWGELGEIYSSGIIADTVFDLPGRTMIDIEEQGFSEHVVFPCDDEEVILVEGDTRRVVPAAPNLLYSFGEHQVRLDDVVITKENLDRFPSPEREGSVKIPSHAFTDAGEWKDVHIRFISLEKADIIICGSKSTGNYKSFGFENKTDGNPIQEWKTLLVMAEYQGKPSDMETVNKHHVSYLRKKLQTLFPNIEGKPFKSYDKCHGWRLNLQLTPFEYPHSQRY